MASASASSRPVFKVAERSEFGSRTTRRLRRTGQVPGVVYTGGEDARPFQADAREISRFLSEGHTLFDLEIEGADAVPVVVKEQQRHPVRGELIHIDLHQVDLTVAIQADVTIELEGAEDAPGVKDGGVLEHVAREITVEGLPADIPENITVDVSEMVIGDTLQLSSITAPEGVEFVADSPEEFTIATLNPPPVIEEPETEVEEETEVIGEGEEAQGEGEDAGESAEGAGDSGGDSDSGDDEG
jgi:large subunit ribosomal protein L25